MEYYLNRIAIRVHTTRTNNSVLNCRTLPKIKYTTVEYYSHVVLHTTHTMEDGQRLNALVHDGDAVRFRFSIAIHWKITVWWLFSSYIWL